MLSVRHSPKIFPDSFFTSRIPKIRVFEKKTSVNEANSSYLTTVVYVWCDEEGRGTWGVNDCHIGWAYDLYTRIGSVRKMKFGKSFSMAYPGCGNEIRRRNGNVGGGCSSWGDAWVCALLTKNHEQKLSECEILHNQICRRVKIE